MIVTASTTSTFGGIPGLDEIAGKLSPWASESIVPSHKNEHGCEVVYDDVWEEKCQTVYNEECATDYVNECQNVNHRECITKNEKQCSWGFKDSCVKIPVPTCNLVWEKKCGLKDVCTTVKERECRSVPKRICTTSHDKVCETREEKVCRQVPVPVETVPHYVPSSYPVESTGKHKSHGYGNHGDGKLAHDLAGKHGESESYFGGFEDLTRGLTDLDFGLGEYGTHGSGHAKGHAGGGKQHKRSVDKLLAKIEHKQAKLALKHKHLLSKAKKVKGSKKVDHAPVVVPSIKTETVCELVPRQKCHSVPQEACREEYFEACEDVPRQVCTPTEKCKDVPKKTCVTVDKEKCVKIPSKECVAVPKEHCVNRAEKVCKDVPREICNPVADKVCQKLIVKRPREVCLPPRTVKNIGGKEW
ncbi:hypothetical protein TCAL_07128 [Tigriopus californicus]|uniref:Uncharacterized protein n=3 Tax=Tigriopus californicus TaxID=6832 RepID=A0A553PCY4_TIGCA|nr:hypothetical protein TCAL_07128 [Tigriopus californicus]|eukprot:TCALIF_07128-PA protein Name:"Protein of unknown function" AED:0.24 eAED:0.25 QI:0/-1/0/1/-1/1/1/0/414